LHKEINIYLLNSKEITYESIGKMEFTQAWIMETLRLGAPTFRTFMREALDDHVIGDIKIKKGTLIDLSFFPNNYSEVYHDEPMKFNPERWLDPKSKSRLSMLKDPFCFVPFSCGPRICVGQHLAILETKVIFGLFVKKFEFKLDPEYKFAMATRFLYEPRDDLIFTLHKRVDLSK
jgi:cytochrome P450